MTVAFADMMLLRPQLTAAPATIEFLQNTVGADATVRTFSAVPIGAADPRRTVAIALYRRGTSPGITSVTFNGVAATLIDNAGPAGNVQGITFAYALVPTGTTVDIVVTTSGTISQALRFAAYRVISVASAPTDTASPADATAPTATLPGSTVGIFSANADSNGSAVSSTTNVTTDLDRTAIGSNRVSEMGRPINPKTAFGVSSASIVRLRAIGWA